MTDLSIIAAISDNQVIGKEGVLPWRLPRDLARFKSLTMGHSIVMGRRTFESIGRPLPGRATIVLTHRADYAPAGVLVAHDAREAVSLVRGTHAFVAGGADIYRLFLPLATRLFLTRVHGVYEGDTFFPPFDPADWRLASEETVPAEAATPSFTFEVYDRATAHASRD